MSASKAPAFASVSSDEFDELPDGVLVTDASGVVLRVNPVFLEMTKRARGEVLGGPLEAIVSDEDPLHLLGFGAIFGQGRVFEAPVIFTSRAGERFPLIASSQLSRDEQKVFLTVRASGAVQKELADTSRWAADEQDKACALAQARDELAGKNAELVKAQNEIASAYARLQGEVLTRERLEEELRLAQKLEAIGQLASGIAHEINTPMQYIGDNIAFLSRAFEVIEKFLAAQTELLGQAEPPALPQIQSELAATRKKLRLDFLSREVPGALSASRSGIEHVTTIVRAMKSFAHVDQGEKSSCDLNQTIRDTLIVAQSEYKAVATAETELAELPPVLCFAGKLNQVLLNLIVNAAHAIADAERPTRGVIRVSSSVDSGVVSISVSDNGAGVPEAIRNKIFDQFFTTKAVGRGTGQGLSLVRNVVVDAHGGTVAFTSEVGVGTTFTIRLPVDGRTKLSAV